MSSCRSYSRAKGPGTSAGAFPVALSLSGELMVQRILDGPGAKGVLWDPPGPVALAGLAAHRLEFTDRLLGLSVQRYAVRCARAGGP